MQNINIHEAKSTLSKLIAAIEEGSDGFTLCRNGVPVAQLMAPQVAIDPLRTHELLTNVEVVGDISAPLGAERITK